MVAETILGASRAKQACKAVAFALPLRATGLFAHSRPGRRREKKGTEVTSLFTAVAAALVLASSLLSLLWFNRRA